MNPYQNLPISNWKEKTIELVENHPLKKEELVKSVLTSWDKIFDTYIGNELKIGKDIKPSPQILGNYLHELIPIYFEKKYNGKWHKDKTKNDKDLVCDFNNFFSIELHLVKKIFLVIEVMEYNLKQKTPKKRKAII